MAATFLEYDVVDVFAQQPFAGNQLAVVHGAADLADDALLALAREFGYSETTFPTPVDGDRYRSRIFTPGGEIPFAGHPTLGTAWVLRERGALTQDTLVQECGAGEIGVRFDGDRVELSAVPRDLVGPLATGSWPSCWRRSASTSTDRDGEAWLAGTGLTFVHLPVKDDAVGRARAPRHAVRAIADLPATGDPLDGLNLYAVTERSDGALQVHSRVFAPGLVPEDPATGSAAAGLGLALHARGVLERRRPLSDQPGPRARPPVGAGGRIDGDDDAVSMVHVAGRVHPIARGQIREPAEKART